MRRLTLKKDTLAELTGDELGTVGGAGAVTTGVPSWEACPVTGAYPTIPVMWCLK